jgi:hypothetical protein
LLVEGLCSLIQLLQHQMNDRRLEHSVSAQVGLLDWRIHPINQPIIGNAW